MGSVLRRLLFFFQRNQFDRDLEDELRFHEEMKAHALADADGMSGDEARAAARRRMGNPLRLREQSREPWIFPTVETFAQDVRHALRLMRRDPAFTFTALATLALGIGLNTAIFSVAYGVLWRPLPYPDPDRLVIVSSAQQTEKGVKTFWTWAPVTYEALRPRVTALDHLAAYSSIDAQLTGRGEPLQVPALDVSPNFFATLGVSPARGRAFLTGAAAPDDDRSRDRQRSAVAHVAQGRSGDRRTVHHHRRRPPYRRRRAAAGLQLQAGDPAARRAAGSGHLSAQSLARRHRQRARFSSCWAA